MGSMERLRKLEIKDNTNEEIQENSIIIKWAKHHNLKNISLKVPKDKLIVFTGVSGSGKSTLVFDIIYAESQSRFMNGLSASTRSNMEKMEKTKRKDCIKIC